MEKYLFNNITKIIIVIHIKIILFDNYMCIFG